MCKGVGQISGGSVTFVPSVCQTFEDEAGGINVEFEGDTSSTMIRIGGLLNAPVTALSFGQLNTIVVDGVGYVEASSALIDTTLDGLVTFSDGTTPSVMQVSIAFTA